MKILLGRKQAELLKRADIEYSPETDYDISVFEDAITDYVLEYEKPNDEVTQFGAQLLDLHDFIVEKYDS
jgi:hypothetical protein